MVLRLAFAISTSITPDILLMDEWISAGDASFTRKAQSRLQRLLGRTGILFIASHSEITVRDNCTRAIWLEHGTIVTAHQRKSGANTRRGPTGKAHSANGPASRIQT
jgi:ABC-type polysaccharide/polyol phosphate transport system ATPase subunit